MAVFADPREPSSASGEGEQGRATRQRAGFGEPERPNTRDVEGAKAFYGAMFGWRTLALDGGPEMWTMPGFGDFLERSNPELRKQMAEAGAPQGFEDVVASINPIAADQPETPAHWSVTFAVDDADASAAKAAELGGR